MELNDGDFVQIVHGPESSLPNGYRSWKKFWINHSMNNWPRKCCILGCRSEAVGSAHIYGKSGRNCVIPACIMHINWTDGEWLNVKDSTTAVLEDSDLSSESEEAESSESQYETSDTEDETSEPDTNESILQLHFSDEVQNIKKTCHCKPKRYSTWKQYWVATSGRDWPQKCRIRKCTESAAGGGHVYIKAMGEDVYIIPMCESHNVAGNLDWYDVKDPTSAARVDKKDAKGRGRCYRK